MSNLLSVTYRDVRVLTTSQLAGSYEAEMQVVVNNFNRNKDRYTEGKHFSYLLVTN